MNFSELREKYLLYSDIDPVAQRYDDGWRWDRYLDHPRPTHGLVYVCSDTVLHYELPGGGTIDLGRGAVLLAPRGCRYRTVSAVHTAPEGPNSYTVNFLLRDGGGHDVSLGAVPTVVAADLDLKTEMAALCRAGLDFRAGAARVQARFLMMLDAVHSGAARSSPAYYVIRRGVEQLERDWNKQEKMEVYARLCGISLPYFHSLFRQWAGLSPVAYRSRLRIARAKELLQSGAGVTQTAAAVGFDDPFYFSRVFKAETGLSPRAYRRQETAL